MPASASASLATLTTRLSTVSASNFPKGVCAHPTMLAVMAFSRIVREICNLSKDGLHGRFSYFIAESHMAVMPAQLPARISAGGQTQETPAQSTLGSASPAPAFATPIPPVGQH